MRSILLALCCGLLVAGCQSRGPVPTPGAVYKDTSGGTYTAGNKTPYVVFGETYEVMPESIGYLEIGVASWYGRQFHGNPTSNGERFDMHKVSAAHKTLPIPTVVRVTNLDNGRSIEVRVNDRGPFHDGRIIDMSYEAARRLGFADKGVAPVVVEALDEVNYPDRFKQPLPHESFYLQVGAYSQLEGALRVQDQIVQLLSQNTQSVDVKILQSEQVIGGDDIRVLHKVWLGPMKSELERENIAQLVQQANLGKPIPVKVE